VKSNIHTLVSGDDLDLGNTVSITEVDTDLRWSGTLLRPDTGLVDDVTAAEFSSHLADLVNDLVGGGLEP
jgi:hypothetical protein